MIHGSNFGPGSRLKILGISWRLQPVQAGMVETAKKPHLPDCVLLEAGDLVHSPIILLPGSSAPPPSQHMQRVCFAALNLNCLAQAFGLPGTSLSRGISPGGKREGTPRTRKSCPQPPKAVHLNSQFFSTLLGSETMRL